MNKQDLIKLVDGKFFTIEFIKKDGQTRVMNCRLGVTKHLRGGKSTTAHLDNLLTVYDVQTEGYRTVNMDTLQRVTLNNYTIYTKQ